MKKLAVLTLTFALLISALNIFSVNAAWESESDIMLLLSELDIMKGDPDGNFRLNDNVSRAECTKIAVQASIYKNFVATGTKTSPFYDVPATHWASPYIQVGVKNKLCQGYIDATFRPDGTVLFEEAITIFLKLLGYTDDDFGSSWPYGQAGIAKQIKLTEGIDKNIGDYLNRRDVMYLTYNMLNTNSKGSSVDYINTLDYSISEDVILISSPENDSSVGSGKIYTSQGTYKVNPKFNYENVGKKGDLIVKNSDEAVGFIPSEQISETYNIYQILNGDLIVMENGAMKEISLDNSLTVYNKSQKTTFSAMLSNVAVGDVLTVYSNKAGIKDYGIIRTGELKGPYTYKGASQIAVFGLNNPTVTRNGSISSIADLKSNDIIYYSENINGIWAYSKTATGIYEKAIPNKDNPTSIVLSNVTYNIESTEAWKKLSSGGNIEYGQRITVLLGKNNDIADVLTESTDTEAVVGYFTESGKRQHTKEDNSTYVTNYAKIILPDGSENEYSVNSDYGKFVNSVVKINFSDGIGKLAQYTSQSGISGTVDYENRKIGSQKLSKDIEIIDVETVDSLKSGNYSKVFLQRLDGVTLREKNVLYAKKNNSGEITELILNDVTGDMYSYGIVTEAKNFSNGMMLSGMYSVFINGESRAIQSSSTLYNVSAHQPAKISFNKTGAVQSMSALTRIDGKVSKITFDNATINNKIYPMWDKAVVYKKDATGNYTTIPLNEVINGTYSLTAYQDKAQTSGGLIRILVCN